MEEHVKAFIEAAAAVGFPSGVRFGTSEGDEYLRSQRAMPRKRPPTPPAEVGRIDEFATPAGVPVRVYQPDAPEALRPLIVYLHGGGWVMGDLEMHDPTCRTLANAAGAVVVNVAYRLAPEHPYPAACDDALEATVWAVERASTWRADPTLTFVAGTSAGANLAAAVALRWRDEQRGPALAGQVLIYPVLDSRMDTPSYRENGSGFFLTADQMRFYWEAYVHDDVDRRHPFASPSRAADLADLAPAVVVTAEHDPLRDEGEDYARRLNEFGGLIELIRVPGQIHGFLTAFPGTPDAVGTLNRITTLIGEVANRAGLPD